MTLKMNLMIFPVKCALMAQIKTAQGTQILVFTIFPPLENGMDFAFETGKLQPSFIYSLWSGLQCGHAL